MMDIHPAFNNFDGLFSFEKQSWIVLHTGFIR